MRGATMSGFYSTLLVVLCSCGTLHVPPIPGSTSAHAATPAAQHAGGADDLTLAATELPAEPPARTGNPKSYKVFGKRYEVRRSSRGYRQQGRASWYGPKFHGRKTSSGEIYDMHQISAAHKSLPIPTFARVTRLDNGKSLIVRINDRGPFVGERVIDLSYAAAQALDMVEEGTTLVNVEALAPYQNLDSAVEKPTQRTVKTTPSPAAPKIAAMEPSNPSANPIGAAQTAPEPAKIADKPPGPRLVSISPAAPRVAIETKTPLPAKAVAPNTPPEPITPAALMAGDLAVTKPTSPEVEPATTILDQPGPVTIALQQSEVIAPPGRYLQIAAYSVRDRAETLRGRLLKAMPDRPVVINNEQQGLYRVRIGPLEPQADSVDTIKLALADLGFEETYLIEVW